jgi:hypothetical protein
MASMSADPSVEKIFFGECDFVKVREMPIETDARVVVQERGRERGTYGYGTVRH